METSPSKCSTMLPPMVQIQCWDVNSSPGVQVAQWTGNRSDVILKHRCALVMLSSAPSPDCTLTPRQSWKLPRRWQNLLESGPLNLVEWTSCAPFHPPPPDLPWNVTQIRNKFLLIKPLKFGSIFITGLLQSRYIAVSK